jgi:hypothetical protein
LDDDEDLDEIETDPVPDVFFRKGGLKRPREEEEKARTCPRVMLFLSDTKVMAFLVLAVGR